ncbi:cystathionine beta-lyase [Candidatus Rickettsiella isopodorum]|jgi:cystathionine beta-lyase/cystathionine gamma-synthase|uniref:Cystathionine beta-lyase n=1 Tax=Candidatus Rickettsiella isopodorum TaxID=1225476 RepID=A0A1J8P6A4_9COXI|nr:PLP-dependent aspartate aminotransferase family protein [Candidatus Rickettsiella isopodorum]MCH9636515.1 PLP-dependent aspartate aminotransferase family protein [Gammaproteobacteria bacterium]MDQ5899907.1 cystathionine gamma-lyase [Pseudomonadota bacterium]MCH9754471.1 PLP-dependent aspartate aminotransferase family protein [Gammaproteobacteria bacterium]MDD4892504.1 PLP-dependent aspartate aminotransferase family protein [Candidatus Rickettsiella isopodorum]MDD5161350.1 PLP-dependent aspa
MKKVKKTLDFATRCIHAGQIPDPSTGALIAPIYATSTYAQKSPGVHQGFEYSRTQNPTRFAYERCIADLENGRAGFAFASGMAAINTLLELLNPGDHIIGMDDLYGGTVRLFNQIKQRSSGLNFSYVDMTDLNNLNQHIKPETKLLWMESPTNPLLKLVDIAQAVKIARQYKIITVLDNTFATPWIQQPLSLGCDLVVHSATKYLNGHSDMIGGIVVVGDNPELIEKISYLQNAMGAIQGPFDSFLALRGLHTLALRMQRHSENALKIAQFLEQHHKVEKVFYPGLTNHPQHKLAKKQMLNGFGGIVSFVLKGSFEETQHFLQRCRLFTLAESLGCVESLVDHPAIMTHAALPLETRERLGITENLLRLSVGIEAVQDLIDDLEQALTS